jgi:hypothetical protein
MNVLNARFDGSTKKFFPRAKADLEDLKTELDKVVKVEQEEQEKAAEQAIEKGEDAAVGGKAGEGAGDEAGKAGSDGAGKAGGSAKTDTKASGFGSGLMSPIWNDDSEYLSSGNSDDYHSGDYHSGEIAGDSVARPSASSIYSSSGGDFSAKMSSYSVRAFLAETVLVGAAAGIMSFAAKNEREERERERRENILNQNGENNGESNNEGGEGKEFRHSPPDTPVG